MVVSRLLLFLTSKELRATAQEFIREQSARDVMNEKDPAVRDQYVQHQVDAAAWLLEHRPNVFPASLKAALLGDKAR